MEGVGDRELVDVTIMKIHLGAHKFRYGDDADRSDASASLRHPIE